MTPLVTVFVTVVIYLLVSAFLYVHEPMQKMIPGMHTPSEPDYKTALDSVTQKLIMMTNDGSNIHVITETSDAHLSDEGQRLMESLTMMANAGKITLGTVAYAMESYTSSDESVEIDYEQPQPMYPELPEQ